MQIQKYILPILIITFMSCKTSGTISKSNEIESNFITDGKLFSSLYIQKAAEYKALCFQAYNVATDRLIQIVQNHNFKKPLAVVTDIDETVLDNTPSSVHQAFLGKDYEPAAWAEWTKMASADTICGAHSFFSFAASKGVEVFYVTNRSEQERAATLKNLQKYNFPFADDKHLLLKNNTSSKTERRAIINETHEIVLLFGDNLSDFSGIFDKNNNENRTLNVRNNAALFGNKFIVLPNPNYGDWENAIYEYNYQLTPQQKKQIIYKSLKTY